MDLQSTVTSKGQITLPKALREALNLKPGDKIRFVPDDRGGVYLRPRTYSIQDLKGILPKPERAVTLEEMDDAIADYLAEKYCGRP